ncbi:hypothetical protein RhiirA5_427734 [Rhizophagus irregularis]|uniref:Uncharacterized protein n=1 Tax=Rhizophagus irregularis TaxID=588596 RepID=A0A2N0P1P9_9GLOM|nr:hypothetical protein RhiirA5_427734 [Rhizophagus irregularis]
MPLPWKYIICRYGKVIKLDCRYDETFLNIHVNGKGCLAKQGVHSAEEWKSDDDKKMDDDDLFNVDEISDVENDCEDEILSDDNMG